MARLLTHRSTTRLALAALSVAVLPTATPAAAPASAAADTTPPVVDAITHEPATPHAWEATRLSATARDESGIASLDWVLGDGGTASGATVQHVYTREGVVTATVTATDGAGNSTTASTTFQVFAAQVEPSYTEPSLTRVRLRPRTISADGNTPGVPRWARLTFRVTDLYDTTRVTLVVRGQGTSARKSWRDVSEGVRTVRWGPRFTRFLPPGRYRVVLRAANRYGVTQARTRLRLVR